MPVNRRRARAPLTRERVLRAAIDLADRDGLEALSMRKLGQELGVEAMSLYNHVANKDEILDGIADLVVGEFDMPEDGVDWKDAMRRRAISAHEVLLRHPWASVLIESRVAPSPTRLRACDSVIGALRGAGFSTQQAYHAFLVLDSYVYGFTLQEVSWAFDAKESPEEVAQLGAQIPADEFPNIAAMLEFVLGAATAGDAPAANGTRYGSEFEFGLDLILDGLERARDDA